MMKIHSEDKRKYPDALTEFPDKYLSEEMAQRNHMQSLERLNERGGMGYFEILCNLRKTGLRGFDKRQNYCKVVLQRLIKLKELNNEK